MSESILYRKLVGIHIQFRFLTAMVAQLLIGFRIRTIVLMRRPLPTLFTNMNIAQVLY